MIKNKQLDPKRVVLISKTVLSDPAQIKFAKFASRHYKKFNDNNRMENIDEDFLTKLYENQKRLKDEGKTPKPWCLVFDD